MENLELAIQQIKEAMPGLEIHENELLSRRCSFHIGGPARIIAVPSSVSSLSKICHYLKLNHLAPYILGNGTNILFPDEGLSELFIISTEKLTKMFLLDSGDIYVEAGVSLAKLASFAQQNSLSGLEFASGIPGTVGGGLMMNAGAYGGEMKDVVQSVVLYYLPEQRLYELNNEQCRFGYRKSLFQEMGGCVILSAVIRCPKGDGAEIAAKMRELNERRRDKQPLDLPSAGSAFRRPEGYFAAALIEEAGLKGFSVGGAQVSEKHSGFVVNTGNASSHDVYELMMHIRKTVFEHSGVVLEPEMIILPPDYKLADHGPAVPLHNVRPNMPAQEETEQEH